MSAATRACLGLAAAALLGGAAPAPSGAVTVAVSGLRSTRGAVSLCLTRDKRAFPDCRRDSAARRASMPADANGPMRFVGLAPGRYAVSVLHDENGNGRADMLLLVPREGFGFSRDAAARFGPPRFDQAAFAVAAGEVAVAVRMRYLL